MTDGVAGTDHGATAGGIADWITVEELGKTYSKARSTPVVALENINFSVAQREFVSIVGPSGCGKTTLLKIVAGLLSRSSGSVRIAGREVEGPQRDIGMVFQSPALLPWRTVLENVMVPVEVQRLDRGVFRKRAHEMLELVGLEGFADKYPKELSGGMQQRVGICRALVHDPDVLLMDEPFGALDAMTREHMNLELLRIWQESQKTVIFVTHSIPEAVFLSDRVLVLAPRPGRVAELVDVAMARPRALRDMATEEFAVHSDRIRRHFDTQGAIH